MASPRRITFLLLQLAVLACGDVRADWPQWRGDGSGVSTGDTLPEYWDGSRPAWRTAIPGEGHSSPVVAGDRVFLTTAILSGTWAAGPSVAFTLGLAATALAILVQAWRGWRVLRQVLPKFEKSGRLVDLAASILTLGLCALGLFWVYRHQDTFVDGPLYTAWYYLIPVLLLCTASAIWLSPAISRWRFLGAALHVAAGAGYALFLSNMGPVSLKSGLFLVWLCGVSIWWAGLYLFLPTAEIDSVAARIFRVWNRILVAALLATAVLQVFTLVYLPRSARRTLSVVCIDRNDGSILWTVPCFRERNLRKHRTNSFATPTPAVRGDSVVAQFAPGLVCLDLEGRQRWRKPILSFGDLTVCGAAISPVVYEDSVIYAVVPDGLNPRSNEHLAQQSFIASLNLSSGEEKWRVTLPGGHDSHSTPFITAVEGQSILLLPAWETVLVYDPTWGNLLRNWPVPIRQCIPSPVADAKRAYVTSGRSHGSKGGFAINLNLNHDEKEPPIAWQLRRDSPNIPSPVLVDDLLYTVTSNGTAQCLVAETGDVVWRERLPGTYLASLVAGDGKVYFTSTEGVTTVIPQGREFKILATNKLGEEVTASPALSRGQIFLRGDRHLFCIRSRSR